MSLIDLSIRTPHNFKNPFREGGAIWSVTSLYLQCLKKYDSNRTKKVIVEITDSEDKENSIEYMLDIIKICRVFNFIEYYESDKYGKKKLLLDSLQAGLIEVAKKEGWRIEPLLDAYNCCLAKKIEHKWLRKDKYFLSPDRKHYAGVYCNWDTDKFEAFVIFLSKQKEEIKRVKLFETEAWNVEPMGKMGWDKNTGEFYMYSKDNKQKWIANV